ncbi:hypothetical protein BX600DRAFT_507547 [Xylariales sp. PMI_506]|nr:hypothetical protein BX600DRAFT_507547 [Xylariales sp. PMI_506]
MSTTFSYAQAARGQLATAPASQATASQALSTTSSQSRDAAAVSTGTTPSAALSTTSNDADASDTTPQTFVQPESVSKGNPENSTQEIKETVPSTETNGTSSLPGQSIKKPSVESSPYGTERRGKSSISARSSDTSDNKKARKGKKGKGSEKDLEQDQNDEKEKEDEPPKVPLSEAPIPTVNIWAQRAKEQQAKTPVAPARATSGQSTNNLPASVEAKPKSAATEGEASATQNKPAPSAGKHSKKANDSVRDNDRRTAPRGSRIGDKPTAEALPPVADVSLWPTPESAAVEVKTLDKEKVGNEEVREDSKQDAAPKGKTNWVSVPYVPTPVFQTQLPTRTARGGRAGGASRGGREAGPRGNHAGAVNAVDRSQNAAGAKSVNGPHERTASITPHTAKRASVDVSSSRDARKASGAKETLKATPAQASSINGVDDTSRPGQNDSSSNTSNQVQATPGSAGTDKRAEAGSRQPDQSKDTPVQNAKESNHHGKSEGGSRDRPRGGQRGRGGHAGANGQNHHHSHGSYPSNAQGYPAPGSVPRQNSYPNLSQQMAYGAPFAGAGPAPGHRSSGQRNNSTSGAFYGRSSSGRGSRGPPVQTPNFHFDPSMHPVSAFPGQTPYYFEQNLLPLVSQQLTYYFSVDNLIKDTWLRKHMDSQGFVFLDVIMNFKRMRSLTQDANLIRAACLESSQQIELVTGYEDGRERIRRVGDWEQFVLPKGQRHEAVDGDDGPIQFGRLDRQNFFPYQPPPMMIPPYGMESPAFSPTNVDHQFAPYMNGVYPHAMINGVNGHAGHGESQLSATVPEFSPAGGSSASDLEPTANNESVSAPGVKNFVGASTNGDAHLTNGAVAQPYQNGVVANGQQTEEH